MRLFRLLPAAVLAIALLATPVQAFVRHRPAERPHKSHARHHHSASHTKGHAEARAPSRPPAVSRAGSVIGAASAVRVALSPGHQIAHAASGTTVTIADFSFTPATITIHVGDTVTWTNHGPSAHTATADNGSFNTGMLQKGQSASHTFTTAGTVTYICSIHPFMHGTVIVRASSSGSGSGSSSTGSGSSSTGSGSSSTGSGSPSTGSTSSGTASTTGAGTPASSSSPSLPNTGLDVGAGALVGLLTLGTGLVIRRRARA